MTPNQPSTMSDRLPLSGITIVDLTQVLAGPFATMTLGDLGAEVVKIEAVGRGDRSRDVSPRPEYFESLNRNKHSIAIDLKADRGQRVARNLVADADVFVESTKPGRIEEFGLDYPTIRAVNGEIIYCSVTGFGSDSPYEGVPAWDMLIQAMSGVMSMTGTSESPPLWSGLPSGDLAAGTYAAQSILAALYAQETGQLSTEWIEVPMLDAAISWLTARAGHTFGTGDPFPRYGTRHPSAAPFGVFETADDPVVIAAGTNSLWTNFCRAIDREDLLADDRFQNMDDRVQHQGTLRETLESTLSEIPAENLVARLQDNGVPAGPINDTATVWTDEHVRRRELKRTMDRGDREATVIDHPVHFSEMATALRLAPPGLGDHTDALLEDAGYSAETIAELKAAGVIE